MLYTLNIFKSIIDFIEEKCGQIVDFVLGLLESFTTIFQALIIVAVAILVLIGTIAVIKKSAKIIITVAAILVILFTIWIFV